MIPRVVHEGGFEPPCLAAPEPKPGAYADSATRAQARGGPYRTAPPSSTAPAAAAPPSRPRPHGGPSGLAHLVVALEPGGALRVVDALHAQALVAAGLQRLVRAVGVDQALHAPVVVVAERRRRGLAVRLVQALHALA